MGLTAEQVLNKMLGTMSKQLCMDMVVDPVSLSGINHADISLMSRRYIKIQLDPLTNSGYRLYFKVDKTEEAGGTTIDTFKPQGYLAAGGCEEFWIDPNTDETPYLHLLFMDGTGTAKNGGLYDYVYFLALKEKAD